MKINSIKELHKCKNSTSKKEKYLYTQNTIRKYKNNEISVDDYVKNVAHYFDVLTKKKK
jgi:O-phosphoseryl-tRNA(Cys) synthetase